MSTHEVQSRVKKVIGNILKINATEIGDEANFIFDLGADSMQSMELVAAFEEEFNIEMDEDKALNVQTVSAATDFIAAHLK